MAGVNTEDVLNALLSDALKLFSHRCPLLLGLNLGFRGNIQTWGNYSTTSFQILLRFFVIFWKEASF